MRADDLGGENRHETSRRWTRRTLAVGAVLLGLSASALAEDSERLAASGARTQPSADFEGNWYVLRKGQTIAGFARETGLSLAALEARFQRIDRAWISALRREIATRMPELKAAWGGRIRLPHAGLSHEIEPDEDIWALSRRFKTSALELRIVNGWTELQAEQLRAGQRVLVPGVVRARDGGVMRLPRPAPKQASKRAERLGLGTRATAGALLRGELEARWIEAAGGDPVPAPSTGPCSVAGGCGVSAAAKRATTKPST
jgi:hypothetical protein